MRIEKMFLSVGTMRAGTTWFYNMIKDHPDLYFTPQKELHFIRDMFSRDVMFSIGLPIWEQYFLAGRSEGPLPLLNGIERRQRMRYIYDWGKILTEHEKSWDFYHKVFSMRGEDKRSNWCVDMCNMTSHLNEHQLKEVRDQFQESKAIYIMRDPVARLWSHFVYWENQRFSEQFPEKDASTYISWLENNDLVYKAFDYATAVENCQKAFGDNFKCIFYEDLIENPHEVFKDLENFLGLSHYELNEEHVSRVVNAAANGHEIHGAFVRAFEGYVKDQLDRLSKLIDLHPKWYKYENSAAIQGTEV